VSSNTLHEFVLGLLSDPTALADFQNDAEGVLGAAGLGDISALDVQEVLPLVLDYVPAGSLPALDGSVLDDLPLDVDVDGPASAISQLHAVTQLVGVSTTDVNLAATGAIAADENGLEAFTGLSAWGLADASGAADITLPGDFSAVNDVTGSLDGALDTAHGQVDDLADSATGALHGATATAGGVTGSLLPGTEGLTSSVFGSVDTLHGVVDGVTGGLTEGVNLGNTLDIGGLDDVAFTASAPLGADTLGSVGGDLASATGLGGVVSNVTDTVHDAHLPGGDLLGVTDLLF
jgi:hypothetical protein